MKLLDPISKKYEQKCPIIIEREKNVLKEFSCVYS